MPGWRQLNWPAVRAEWLALLLIAALAAGLRFWRIGSLPPGLHYDEAYNADFALRFARGDLAAIYIQASNAQGESEGEEPMHIFLTSLLFRLVGPTPIGGRLVSAASGVVTVIGTYCLGVELFRTRGPKAARRIGVLASLFLATWYWPFHYNRVGMEPSMVPMTAVYALLFTWRAGRTRAMAEAVAAGALTALSLYTYPAGRVVPVVAALAVIHYLAAAPRDRRTWVAFGLMGLAGVVVALPITLFFAKNPDWFFLRLQQTAARTVGSVSPVAAAWHGVRDTLVGFAWRGDLDWRHNIPGRPMFDPVQLVFLAIGALAALWRLRQVPYGFLLAWAALGLLPTALSEHPPSYGRALGATPPLALLAGLGLWIGARWIAARSAGRAAEYSRAFGAAVLGMALAYSGGRAFADYFGRWARAPELFTAFDVGLRTVGEYAASLPADEPIYLSPVTANWYTLRFAVRDDPARLRSFNGRECLVFPANTQQRTHTLLVSAPGEDTRSLARLQALFPAGQVAWQTMHLGQPYAVDFVVPGGQPARLEPALSRQANFNGQARLGDYSLEPLPAKPGQPLLVRVVWEVLEPLSAEYTVFVHVLEAPPSAGAAPVVRAQRDTQPCDRSYPTTHWAAGEIVWDDYRISLPADLAPGTYSVRIGMYNLATGERLPIRSADSDYGDNSLLLGTVEVGP